MALWRRTAAVALIGFGLSGCAISTPLGPIFGTREDAPSTGSITPRDGRFTQQMTDEDWSRARGALETALATDTAGKPAPWDNPASGLKGTVAPVATAYAAENRTCHAFVASVVESAKTHWYQGRACRTPESTWTVVESADWAPPGQG